MDDLVAGCIVVFDDDELTLKPRPHQPSTRIAYCVAICLAGRFNSRRNLTVLTQTTHQPSLVVQHVRDDFGRYFCIRQGLTEHLL